MPKIRFVRPLPDIEAAAGTTLMKALQAGGRPVASSCGGEGICMKCLVQIVEGKENLSPESPREKDLREIHEIPRTHRISCQCQVLGDIRVDTTYW